MQTYRLRCQELVFAHLWAQCLQPKLLPGLTQPWTQKNVALDHRFFPPCGRCLAALPVIPESPCRFGHYSHCLEPANNPGPPFSEVKSAACGRAGPAQSACLLLAIVLPSIPPGACPQHIGSGGESSLHQKGVRLAADLHAAGCGRAFNIWQ